MENTKLILTIDAARQLSKKVQLTAEREDNGELFSLGHTLRYGSVGQIERATRTLATKYEDADAQKILLGFAL